MTNFAQIACAPITAYGNSPPNSVLGGSLFPGTSWLELSVLALVVSTIALSLLYMFASFLRNPQLLSWTKFELFQLFGTAVIIVFFGTVLAGMCTFDMSFLQPARYAPGVSMYDIIDNYFSRLEEVGFLVYGYMMYVTKIMGFLSRVTMLSSPLGIGSNENPMESVGQINSLIFVMLSGFITSFLLLELQMRILDYLAIAIIGFLFPLGIFFRCFEPTRSFGGTLLGISVALFLFYPILMVFNDFVMFATIEDLAGDQTASLRAAAGNVASGNTPSAGQFQNSTAVNMTDPSGYNSFSQGVTGGILFLLKPVLVYVIAAVVLPVLNFIVLVETTRGATAFFGDELDVSNLTRLI